MTSEELEESIYWSIKAAQEDADKAYKWVRAHGSDDIAVDRIDDAIAALRSARRKIRETQRKEAKP